MDMGTHLLAVLMSGIIKESRGTLKNQERLQWHHPEWEQGGNWWRRPGLDQHLHEKLNIVTDYRWILSTSRSLFLVGLLQNTSLASNECLLCQKSFSPLLSNTCVCFQYLIPVFFHKHASCSSEGGAPTTTRLSTPILFLFFYLWQHKDLFSQSCWNIQLKKNKQRRGVFIFSRFCFERKNQKNRIKSRWVHVEQQQGGRARNTRSDQNENRMFSSKTFFKCQDCVTAE